MTIYIDPPRKVAYRNFKWSSHMMTDGEIEELHKFAEQIGMKRQWFQSTSHPHYDLFGSRITRAIAAGAVMIPTRSMIRLCVLDRVL